MTIPQTASSHLLIRARSLLLPPAKPSNGRPFGRCARPAGGIRNSTRCVAGLSFFDFSANVERAALASLCPRRFGVDGIILFYDITTLPFSMGLPFELLPGSGPVPDRPIRSRADLERLNPNPDPESYQHIIELLHRVKSELNGSSRARLRGGAVHGGGILHRHGQAYGPDASLREGASRQFGAACSIAFRKRPSAF